MPEKVSIWSEEAPQPFGHYAQAVKLGNAIYISGQLPIDPATGKPVLGSAEEQSRLVLKNMTGLMQACGGQLSHLMMTTLYLTDLKDFPAFDKVSKEFFFFLPPARTTVCVAALPGGARVCMDGIAELTPSSTGGPKMI